VLVFKLYAASSNTYSLDIILIVRHNYNTVEVKVLNHEEVIFRMRQGEKPLWGEIGAALDYIDKKELWLEEAENLTQWITNLGKEIGEDHTYLFRYMSAARYYSVFAKLVGEGAPSLKEFSQNHNWEMLELYKRISMVASETSLKELRGKILDKTISRAEMRRLWAHHRPALEGKSFRGRGASRDPDKKIKARSDKVYESFCLEILRHENSQHIRTFDSPFWKVIPGNPNPGISSDDAIKGVLMETSGEESNDVILHALMFVNYKQKKNSWPRYPSTYKKILPFYDSIWIVTNSKPTPAELEITPPYIGIFLADQTGVFKILRAPIPVDVVRESDRRIETYKALLTNWVRS
jgi:hypothetical protein